MSENAEVGNVANEYNFENSVLNLSNDLTEVNKEISGKGEPQVELKLPSYKSIIGKISKVPKKTIPVLTNFERARIIGLRMQQLSVGAKPCVDTRGLRSIEEIAYAELNQRKMPLIIKRPLPNGTYEYWKMEEFLTV